MPKIIIGKPATMKAAAKIAPPKIEDVEDVIEVPKPARTTVQGPDLNVRVPGNPNGEPVLPYAYRGFFFGG